MSHAVRIEDLYLEGPEASGGSQEISSGEMKDLCNQAEGSTLSQEVMLMVKTRDPLVKAAANPSDSEVPSSSSDENSRVHIRKTICSKLLLENQEAHICLPSSPFMAVGNNPQVDPPLPVQLGVTR
ncbi:hypothetical protein H920_11956 [Fukomys damarensis]|uniref:Uncharacterized protein n=1 Tax=Fukomys damarensis TaxID=885580 RepID=A0A091D655_FUKDA|nr:hypothetical protein H920_11956 [Fukomys damarensis]